ncbi:membrane protein of er body-like protein [Phtheirospermum japonicum]|uniref:Membrane protein of er body-like protein n=1 Tax=Phtheirospermum japonicum TaxID=374723 RepID=A0A830CD98_9LAMI|nr:membrane protein of er body-like protein [Phtheirospermum japonicum]
MEKEEPKWEQFTKMEEQEEEQEEEESDLVVRKSRNGNESQTNEIFAAAVDDGGETKMEELDGVLENEPLVEEEEEEEREEEAINGEQKKENLVFFDKAEGVDSTNLEENQIVEKSDILSLDFVLQKNPTTAINDKFEGDLANNTFSSPNHQPSQVAFSNEIENAEVDLLDGEDDLEVTDLDVEQVLKKQNTHDLYCPNCNSCITRRVILRKRKRRVRVSGEEAKRNKTEIAVEPALGTGSVRSRGAHVEDSDAHIPTVDEDERERGPDIFRCLSCFSFFIPTGNGLFKLFGEKNGKEKIEDERAPASVKKNWFTSMFASNNKPEANVEQGSSFLADVRKSDVRVVSSSNVGDRSGQTSFSKYVPSPSRDSKGLVGTAGNSDTLESGDNMLHFPNQKPSINGNLITGAGYKFDTTRTETVDATMEQFDSYTEDQLKESKSSKEVHVIRENNSSVTTLSTRTQVINGESNEDTVSFSQQDGLKLLISSNNGSLILENSKDGQIINQTMQSAGHVHSTETSQHIITTTKFEVHSGEPLKVNNVTVLKGVSFPQGKDTVINIDSQPNGLSQTVQEITGQTETSSLLQPSTQINIADRERTEERKEYKIEVIKSIVYGGLAESITSLMNILALAMANLIGGLFIICHNLWELRCDHIEQVNTQISDQVTDQRDRYKELLGRRQNFVLHAIVAILSYLVFGLVPPVVYGFSFRKTDDKQLKLVVVAASSLICIVVLAIGRAYVCRPPKPYLKSVVTFVVLGFMVSGVSYAAGELVERLLEKLGLFQTNSVSGLAMNEMMMMTGKGSARASY